MGASLNTPRGVGRALHACVIPTQATVPEAWDVFDSAGKLKDPAYEERLLSVGREVTRFARLHRCEQALDFLRSWEKAHQKPGA